MKQKKYTILSLSVAILFWFTDTFIHYFIYGEPDLEFIPEDFNELWMRTFIIVLMIAFGIYIDRSIHKLLNKEKQLEATRIYKSMVFATHHILNNLLNQMQLVKLEASNSKDFDPQIIKLYDETINEAQNLIHKLSDVENITDKNIFASVDPGNILDLSNSTKNSSG